MPALSRSTGRARRNALDLPTLLELELALGEMPLRAARGFERAMVSLVFDSDDAHEGCAGFFEKRKPVFPGR